jgi:hypothetical protein
MSVHRNKLTARMTTLRAACRLVFHGTHDRYLALGVFVLAMVLYLLTLPASYTNGMIGPVSLPRLTAELFFFSVVLAGLLSLVLTLNLDARRASLRRRGPGLGAAGAVTSLVPGSFCCTALVPSLLAGETTRRAADARHSTQVSPDRDSIRGAGLIARGNGSIGEEPTERLSCEPLPHRDRRGPGHVLGNRVTLAHTPDPR